MKRWVLIAAFGLLQAGNLYGQELPDGWFPVGDAREKYSLDASAQAGLKGQGLRVIGSDSDGNFGGVGQAILADDYLGRKVRLSGHIRTVDVTGVGGLWLRIDGAQRMIVLDNMQSRGPTGTTNWQEYSVVLPVSVGARQLVFGVILSGSGELHADELVLEIVPDDTPTTAGRAISRTPKSMGF